MIIGITTDRTNPEFTSSDFLFWMPQYTKFLATEQGTTMFNKIYAIVNAKIFKSIYGSDWELAMCYAIAHYMTLIANNMQAPSGNTLETIAGGGVITGILSSASVGGFTKSYDFDKTLMSDDSSKFWNLTKWGAALMALLETKSVASIMVVTNNQIPNCPVRSLNVTDTGEEDG